MWAVRWSAPIAILLALSGSARAQEEDDPNDFALEGGAWNSVSALVRLSRDRHAQVVAPSRLDVGTLEPRDAVLILHPREALPGGALTAFMRAGGRVALADDYGEGTSLLEVFRIGRGAPTTSTAMRLRGNPELLVARPVGSHRLTNGVTALVANHPRMVYHRELAPLFELSAGEALVLAGAVGEGRLVVIGDSSVFIDNMMALRGNRRFAENLIAYLEDGRGGRLFVVGPDTAVVGRFGEPGADRALHDLRATLEALATLDVPPLVLRIGSVALALVAAILAFGALPRRSPYRSARMFAREPAQGGFVGRVGYFGRQNGSLLAPILVYKFELEAALLERLSLAGRALLKDVVHAMRARGIGEDDVNEMRALLLELDRLRDLADRTPAPRIGERRFRRLVATGERLLARVGEERA